MYKELKNISVSIDLGFIKFIQIIAKWNIENTEKSIETKGFEPVT